ncbi:hypothetical protein X798_01607 [Onchocerca flexuosa]|uniref:Uncharacterized protein n=1 Tax=Onchocerca flexuosa TaxID=387005 RepID=A0A238C142_9BILA|nr:hypothetical protein X798_01607 [Onchocerca flexuosa]
MTFWTIRAPSVPSKAEPVF